MNDQEIRKFSLAVVEEYRTNYIVEAHDLEEAKQLFELYMEDTRHEEALNRDLERGFNGREIYGTMVDLEEAKALYTDISYKEIQRMMQNDQF